ncbi:50S ribosomal protein L22 [Candidatus Woesebacteria bacterium]|nr:50S ribosomal protein L22 [Candidatus Woesebacteria bacterium]
MDIISTQKFILLSPRKIRPVVAMIKKMTPQRAVEVLPYVSNKSADPLIKTIKTAIANARVRGFSESDLTFKEIQIGEGPRLKRGNPVSRGQWHPIKKRMAHIRVVLQTVDAKPAVAEQSEDKEEKKEEKKSVSKLKTLGK